MELERGAPTSSTRDSVFGHTTHHTTREITVLSDMVTSKMMLEMHDREALKELRYRYGRRIDTQSWQAFLDLFTDDATCQFAGIGSFTGRSELRQLVEDYIESNYEYTCHLFHHPIIDLDGDTATGSWLLEGLLAHHDGTFEWRQGRYEDRYRRVGDAWKFTDISLDSQAIHEGEFDLIDHEAYGRIPRIR